MQREVLLAAIGSAGDVHPMIGLGEALRRRGQAVTVFAAGYFRETVEAAGLRFAEVVSREEYLAMVEHPDLWHARRGTELVLKSTVEQLSLRLYQRLTEMVVPGRTLLAGTSLAFGARLYAEKHGVPVAMVHLQPSILRSRYEAPVLPVGSLRWAPPWLMGGLWRLVDLALARLVDRPLNQVRAAVGLGPVRRAMNGWIYSPQLNIGMWPEWFASPQPDWPPGAQLVGFPLWDAAADQPLPNDVQQFLAAGERPIAFTVGSAMAQAQPLIAATIAAVQRLGRRAIVLTRFAEQVPRPLPESVMHATYVPLGPLLPQCAAMVHHGGIGTMAQCFAAGVPQLIVPLAHDQFDNADRVFRLGAGLVVPRRGFTPIRVAAAIDRIMTAPTFHARTQEIRDRLQLGDPALELAADALLAMSDGTSRG